MKKLLLASTALLAGAVAAAADTGVTISGYGRFGVDWNDAASTNKAQVTSRLRFNIDAKTETDSGVVFGGRIRLQHSNGQQGNLRGVNLNPITPTTPTGCAIVRVRVRPGIAP